MLEHLLVRERGVGHRSQKTCVSPYGFSILREPHGLIGPQRTDTDQDGHMAACLLTGSLKRPAALGA